jgi:hypothetical protein
MRVLQRGKAVAVRKVDLQHWPVELAHVYRGEYVGCQGEYIQVAVVENQQLGFVGDDLRRPGRC